MSTTYTCQDCPWTGDEHYDAAAHGYALGHVTLAPTARPEKFLEGALEATSTPWNPPDVTVPAEDFDRVVEALDSPQPTPPELLAKRDEVFEKLGKPKFREEPQRDDLGATIDWCRELLTQHVPDAGGKHCAVCCLRLPCDYVELATAVLYLHGELEYQRDTMSDVIRLGDSTIKRLGDKVTELEYEAMGDDL